jgi:hypothetical protein
MRTFITCLLAVDILFVTANMAAADQPQPSGQQNVTSQPPQPSKNTPVAQLSTPPAVQYQLQAVPPPSTPPVVQMLYAAPAVQPVQYVSQTSVQYVQQPTVLAGLAAGQRTIVMGPGPLRLAGVWLGRQLVGLGKTHVWQVSHSVVAPVVPAVTPSVQPVVVQPAAAPTVYYATMAGPPTAALAPAPPPVTYQLVPVTPTAPPVVRSPEPLREAAPPPPAVPSGQTNVGTMHPAIRALFGR